MKLTLSVIKADIGGYVGHSDTHPEVVQTVREVVSSEVEKGNLIDCGILTCGDDIAIVMTHTHGVLGPGVAEMEFEERPSEPVIVFFADKTSPSAWNLPLYEMFADPMNTAGLVIDPKMHDGYTFEVLDVYTGKAVKLNTPAELYDLLALIGSVGKYVVKNVYRNYDGEIAATASTNKSSIFPTI